MHMKKKNSVAYTMIEIMITLVIAASLIIMGIFTLTSYMPKQRLLDSLETTEQMLSRAQMESTSRSIWSCLEFTPAPSPGQPANLTVRMDSDGDRNCEGSDQLITTQQLRPNVSFANCAGGSENSFDFTSGPVWFDTAGVPRNCVATVCTPTSFQFILRNVDLPSGNRAREVEAISSGLISIVARNEKGYMQGIFAKSATEPSGCE